MELLPSKQTEAQKKALARFLETGNADFGEPCDCNGQIRHNNGGNYHEIVSFRLDAGKVFRLDSFTGDYAPADNWIEVAFHAAIDSVASLAALGW